MRFLKPILVAAATVGVVAAGAASSFGAVSGPTATLNSTTTSSVPQLNSSAGAAGQAVPGMAAPSAADSQPAKVPQLASGFTGATMTRQNAIDAALAKTVGASVVSAQRSHDRAALVWKVRLNSNGSTVDYRVNASTGAVTLQIPAASVSRNSDIAHR